MRNVATALVSILVAICLTWSIIEAEQEYQTVKRPVIVDDLMVGQPGVSVPDAGRTFMLPPGTVIDSSYYDWQRNGSLNRRIWVNSDGSIHATYMKSPDAAWATRGMIYYYSNELGASFVSYGDIATFRNGFGNLAAFPITSPTAASAVLTTHDFVTNEAFAYADAFQGVGAFAEMVTNSADQVVWPKPTVNSDGSITIIGTANGVTHNGIANNVGYDRAVDAASGFSQTWAFFGEDPARWENADMQWPAIASGENGKVGIVIPDFARDIHFYESIDNGITFVESLITNVAEDTVGLPTGPDTTATIFLPWINNAIVYIGEEPHIVWTGLQGAQQGGVVLIDYETRILHWSPSTGIDTVVISNYQGAIPSDTLTFVDGTPNFASIDWPEIGVSPDGSTLFVVYTAFNPDDYDATTLFHFGDILGVYSTDNGETWSEPINISNPGGLYPGADDRYVSISPVNHEAALEPGMDAYIVYQSDGTAGSFVQAEENANWDYFLFTGVDFEVPDGIGDGENGTPTLPRALALHQNYPNPFNPSTTISFVLPDRTGGKQPATLTVYDIRGRRVRTLVASDMEPGRHSVTWNGRDERGKGVSSGIYFYTLKTEEKTFTRKMIILK
jgi:hypothetical protein